MKRRRNYTIYTGLVGARMPLRKPRAAPVRKVRATFQGGPFDGKKALLSADCPGSTLEIVVGGRVGRYVGWRWTSSHQQGEQK